MLHRSILLAIAVAAVSCGEPRARAALLEGERLDSAGVEIVIHSYTREAVPSLGWLDSVPDLEIGADEGSLPFLFSSIPALGVLSDGTIVVVDGGTQEIRLFDSTGGHLGTFGGRGEGPGEFSRIGAMEIIRGDSIAVWDGRLRRASILGPSGVLGRTFTLSETGGGWAASVGFTGRADVVVTSFRRHEPALRGVGRARRYDSLQVTVYHDAGAEIDTVGVYPGAERIKELNDIGDGRILADNPLPPFARETFVEVASGGVIVARNHRFEIRTFDVAGELRRILRLPNMVEQLGSQEVETYRRFLLGQARSSTERGWLEDRMDGFPPPRDRPAFGALVEASDGKLWVADYVASGELWAGDSRPLPLESRVWWVFHGNGDLLGQIELPGRFDLMAMTGESVFGVALSELDVPRVERYRIHTRSK
jgi:hypothetical protein